MEPIEDDKMVQRAAAGDRSAFGILYTKYYRRLFSYCRSLVQDPEAASDVVQTAFTKAWESLPSLERPGSFYFWIFTIARNESYNVLRSRRNGFTELLEDVWDPETPHEHLVRQETSHQVDEGLNHLKPEYREVLILRHVEKLSYVDIAAITGDTVSSVESRLFKARKALIKYLTPKLQEGNS